MYITELLTGTSYKITPARNRKKKQKKKTKKKNKKKQQQQKTKTQRLNMHGPKQTY